MIEVEQNRKVNTCVISPSVIGMAHGLSEESRLQEAIGLAYAINLNILQSETIKIKNIRPATYFSHGIIDRLLKDFAEKEIELLIVDSRLTPIQQRNLERALKIKVIDRTALILEIFGERAQTSEGVLQVELAHLTYQRSRLVRSWTHLERQRGGAGFLGGPGETQIELDRRIIDDKIVRIKKDLEKVKQTRGIQRTARKKVPYPIVALVGYTNAGKSSLFNAMVAQKEVMTADMLFATLDTTMSKITLPSGREAILSDTVGFISDLPHELVMSFRATLEEVLNADIILHVRDVSNSDNNAQCNDVLEVLSGLGLKDIKQKENYIEVFNKSDLLNAEDVKYWHEKVAKNEAKVLVSAINGDGIEKLLTTIDKKLSSSYIKCKVELPISDGKIKAWLYRNSEVVCVENELDRNTLTINISSADISRLRKMSESEKQINIRICK